MTTTKVTCHHCQKEFEPLKIFGKRISACCSDECTAEQKKRYCQKPKEQRKQP